MQRQTKLYLTDIKESIQKIETYTKGIDFKQFRDNEIIADAVVRNLEIIGEAVKKIPTPDKNKNPEIEWKKIAGLRDILIHEYFGIDATILWDIIKTKINELKITINKMLKETEK